MPATTSVKQLTPLDQSMPRTYISAVFVFKETSPTPHITQRLQHGLKRLSKQIPWLAGKVFQGPSTKHSPLLEIRWNSEAELPNLIGKGAISTSIEDASSRGMPAEAIPADVWPVPSMLDDTSFKTGIPVFAANTFRFADGGMGLCISISHNVVDATELAQIVRLWARNANDPESSFSPSSQTRSERLSEALSHEFQETFSLSTNELFKRHPEYSSSPPAFPEEWPSCTSKLFTISMHWINILKGLLENYTINPPTTNTIIDIVAGLLEMKNVWT
jgi:hypothetical protein